MIPFTCPHCGLETDVLDQFAGQTGPCAGCGREVTVPVLVGTKVVSASPRKSVGRTPLLRISLFVFAGLCCLVVFFGVLIVLLTPAIQTVRENSRRSRCSDNLTAIYHAMEAYQQDNGSYPPAYTVDEKGQPLHSWRVLLLPYMGPQAEVLYRQLHLDEPWDSTWNAQFANQMPSEFACPSDPDRNFDETSYVVVTGKSTMFPDSQSVKISDCPDGLTNTVLVVELHQSGINWLDPQDVPFALLANGINSGTAGSCCSKHAEEGMNALFADGSIHFLSEILTPEELKSLATRNGGEQVTLPEF